MKPTDDEPLVVRGLWKSYRRNAWALRDVSLSIPTGTMVALVGPNGAGKTSLMRIWAGFERPTRGTAGVMGFDPWRRRSDAVMHLAYVAQQPALYRGLSVRDHLAMAWHLRPTFDSTGATQRLVELGISLDLRAGDLSGGQQAQVSLVIAIGMRADILLLDEPLASLDPLARRRFLRLLLASTRERGTTTVLSSHLVTDIADVCDRIVVMAAGQVMLDDTISTAIGRHAVSETDQNAFSTHDGLVGSFDDLSGVTTFLLRRSSAAPGLRRPSLDELVMGYLAGGDR